MQISDEYRSARKLVILFCALSLAWSAAQIELKVISVEIFGEIDLSGAAIGLVLFLILLYMLFRCALEFSMQAVEVRRWGAAQFDLTVVLNIVRFSILTLAVSGFVRTIYTLFYVVIFIAVTFILFLIIVFICTLVLSRLLMKPMSSGKRSSVAGAAIAAVEWATVIVFVVFLSTLVAGGFLITYSESVRALWPAPPTNSATVFFVISTIIVLLSLSFHDVIVRKLFARPPSHVDSILPDGRIQTTHFIQDRPKWDWSGNKSSESDSSE